jgi:hypothetical protein
MSSGMVMLEHNETLRIKMYAAGLWLLSVDKIKKNSVVLVRKPTIPTERTPHVGEVSANKI